MEMPEKHFCEFCIRLIFIHSSALHYEGSWKTRFEEHRRLQVQITIFSQFYFFTQNNLIPS